MSGACCQKLLGSRSGTCLQVVVLPRGGRYLVRWNLCTWRQPSNSCSRRQERASAMGLATPAAWTAVTRKQCREHNMNKKRKRCMTGGERLEPAAMASTTEWLSEWKTTRSLCQLPPHAGGTRCYDGIQLFVLNGVFVLRLLLFTVCPAVLLTKVCAPAEAFCVGIDSKICSWCVSGIQEEGPAVPLVQENLPPK